MEVKDYIESGILELYVAGSLSEKENEEVAEMMKKHPEVYQEVIKIEASIMSLTAAASPSNSANFLADLKSRLGSKDIQSKTRSLYPRSSWVTYSGWAAAVVVGFGLWWTVSEIDNLREEIRVVETRNELMEEQIERANTDLSEAENLIGILRDRDIITVPLQGQEASPEAYAKVYWNKKGEQIFLDAQGLPEPPRGKVYQVWSLRLSPLTPTSLGTIEDFSTDENKIFSIPNPNESEAFGITLEPAGGSLTPTLEQLYTIGVVESTS
ncbi:anti-sigma factor [Salinimicrobium oceani]|uniref:Anti-sigma factor n=1 Tax=Salinimicrobium oceani TaxID=2722702 RepID=A0ABX1D1N2_9FLAO|nr:anti-sigma factor [Salinimicrobium oceani]NJW53068.1 anti-sigma factor [Salinimicrobium oceani]